MPAPVFSSGNKIYLDSIDIYTICLSAKLACWYLGLYTVEKQVSLMLYKLKLLPSINRLYSVFNVVKSTAISVDSIPS